MPLSRSLTIFLRRLCTELLEIVALVNLLPLFIGETVLAYSITRTIAMIRGSLWPEADTLLLRWAAARWFGIIAILVFGAIFFLTNLTRLVAAKNRWTVRRKLSIHLTLVTFGYMALFTLLFVSSRQEVPVPWIISFLITIGLAAYGFGVRYLINRLTRRLNRPQFSEAPTVPQNIIRP